MSLLWIPQKPEPKLYNRLPAILECEACRIVLLTGAGLWAISIVVAICQFFRP